MRLLIATGNAHKLQEIRADFNKPGIEMVGLGDLPGAPPDVEETGETFEANALLKAVGYAAFGGMWTLADDSGLAVDALNGEPGIYSARYAGTHGDDAANNQKVLKELEGVPVEKRTARYVCAVAIAHPDGRSHVLRATCEGRIDFAETGTNGFGYDPMFIPDGQDQTFGMLEPEVKSRISHRAKAVRLAVEQWGDLLLTPSS